MEWVDQEWPECLKKALTKLWRLYDEERCGRIRDAISSAEEYYKLEGERMKLQAQVQRLTADLNKAREEKIGLESRIQQVLNEREVSRYKIRKTM